MSKTAQLHCGAYLFPQLNLHSTGNVTQPLILCSRIGTPKMIFLTFEACVWPTLKACFRSAVLKSLSLASRVYLNSHFIAHLLPLQILCSKTLVRQENKMVELSVDVEYISPWKHQEYTLKHRRVIRTLLESREEYLTSGKEYIEPRKTQ